MNSSVHSLVAFLIAGLICVASGCVEKKIAAQTASAPPKKAPRSICDVEVAEIVPEPIVIPPSIGVSVEATKLTTYPEAYEIRVRYLLEHTEGLLDFSAVLATLEKIELWKPRMVSAGTVVPNVTVPDYDATQFLRLEVVVKKLHPNTRETEILVTYVTPEAVQEVDLELLRVVLTSVKAQLETQRK